MAYYNKVANLFMGLLCLTFCLREVEVEDFDIPQILIDLFSGSGKRIILVPLWVGLTLWILKDTKIYLQNALGYIKTKFMLFIFPGAAFLMSAELFEKHFVHIEPAKFYEEFLELVGYWCVFVAAVLSRTQKQIEK